MDEIMEDGNLVDRVRILLQRDMQYYQAMQTVLRENICGRVCGGKLDFPRLSSFAAVKIVKWWEAEFLIAFKFPSGLCISLGKDTIGNEDGQVVKKTKPSEFILLVVDTSEQLTEHLHTLIQESLDHADLTVLTATLGAAALIRNCLWCYHKKTKGKIPDSISVKLHQCFKSYQEMAEAVAERLLDLHCRLISLYILNEVESLSWHNKKPFFEKERSSFIIQMWWLYMQGTKADLWNTVSPKMAQRIFAGMLNESLTIIVTRFIYGRPSLIRSEQFWADGFNVLSCCAYLSLAACSDGNELIGSQLNKLSIVMRDIHTKCTELLICLFLRGTPLKILYQACRNGLENMQIIEKRNGIAPWLMISAPKLFGSPILKDYYSPLDEQQILILEMNVLRSQPQPNWILLLKILSMNKCSIGKILLCTLMKQCINERVDLTKIGKIKEDLDKCDGYFCTGCLKLTILSPTLCLYSLMYIIINSMMDLSDLIISALKKDIEWSNYLDRQQVWNQSRPAWLNALLAPFKDIMKTTVVTLLEAVKTGASIYQAMSLTLVCFSELFVCIPISVLQTIQIINKHIPAHCHPIGNSVILQVFCAALYTCLFEVSVCNSTDKFDIQDTPRSITESYSFDPADRSASATALAEALCSIDEDNKHTDQIQSLLKCIEKWIKIESANLQIKLNTVDSWIETYTNQLLLTKIGRRSMKVSYEYVIRTSNWILKYLNNQQQMDKYDFFNDQDVYITSKRLTYIMFHIEDEPFDQWMTNLDETNWQSILNTPLSVTLERIKSQILVRPELKNIDELSQDEKDVAIALKQLCSNTQTDSD